MAIETTTVPADVVWWVRPGDTVAHAFSRGPGWSRSCCRDERWTAAVRKPHKLDTTCPECQALVDGAAS